MIKSSITYRELLSHDDEPGWKVQRYAFAGTSTETIGVMQPGYLVKMGSDGASVVPALAADDANLVGIIVDLPDPQDDPAHPTVAVAFEGSFNARQIHYADAWSADPTTGPAALSVAAINRLRSQSIFIDPTVGIAQPGVVFDVDSSKITSALTATVVHAQAFTYTITGSNGPTAFHAGNLPAGLTLSGAVISGTAPAAGTYNIDLWATNVEGNGPVSVLVLTVT